MAGAFVYKPKFVDIRIRPPREEQARPRPEEMICQHPGCNRKATCRAPKSRDNPHDVWMFCEEHAAHYNRNWNYFNGMGDDDLARFEADSQHGHRPTWSWKAAAGAREFTGHRRPGAPDPRETLRRRARAAGMDEAVARRPRAVRNALDELDLPHDAEAGAVRKRYAELVKRFHPDSNGGDRSSETKLQKVVKAYQLLKRARLA
jgi:hypothetical protein